MHIVRITGILIYDVETAGVSTYQDSMQTCRVAHKSKSRQICDWPVKIIAYYILHK